MFFLTFIAGVLALISTILASTDQRRYESALLHTIGAKRSKIFQSVATEFVALGIGAGFTAVLGTMIISGSLATQIFNVNYTPNVVILLSGMFSGAFCIGLVGVFAVREAVYAPPLLTLRGL
jgi:putative ABC transport system permease protein